MLAQRSVPNPRVEYVDLVAARTAIQPGQSGGVAFPAAGFQSCRRLSPYPRLARGCSFGPEAGALGYRIGILASSAPGFRGVQPDWFPGVLQVDSVRGGVMGRGVVVRHQVTAVGSQPVRRQRTLPRGESPDGNWHPMSILDQSIRPFRTAQTTSSCFVSIPSLP